MYQIGTLSALRPIAGNEDEGLRHQLSQNLPLLGIGRADHSAHIAVITGFRHAFRSPCRHLLADILIERSSVDQSVLKFTAAGVGGLYQNENALLLLRADLGKRLNAIRTEIGIHRHKVLVKACIALAADLDSSQMSDRICLRGGTNVPALDVADYDQPLLLTVVNGLLKGDHAWYAKLFIHGNLRLHRRNQIIDRIHQPLIVLPDRLCCALQRLSGLCKRLLFDIFRYKFHHRIQSDHDRCIRLSDSCNKSVNHFLSSCCLIPVKPAAVPQIF